MFDFILGMIMWPIILVVIGFGLGIYYSNNSTIINNKIKAEAAKQLAAAASKITTSTGTGTTTSAT